jgi:hypothetical protein
MSEIHHGGCTGGAIRPETARADGLGAADWLYLAATPTFAIMALLTALIGGGQPDILCSAAEPASPLSGMIPMYLLMSAFHSAPWLKLISHRRSGRGGASPAPATPFAQCKSPQSDMPRLRIGMSL